MTALHRADHSSALARSRGRCYGPNLHVCAGDVAVEDTDAGVEVYINRLLELQIDKGLAVYVVPVRPWRVCRPCEARGWCHHGYGAPTHAACRS
jgi:hypothetical protein